jgi:glycosyltransferase involved in cell wall biosynthesis
MVNVLIVAGAVPARRNVLVEALKELRARGAVVQLFCHFAPDQLTIDADLARVEGLPTTVAGAGPRLRVALRYAEPPRRVWLTASRDRRFRDAARRADVLVALDTRAIHTVWQLAQRNRRAHAVYGLAPALKAVGARLDAPGRQPVSERLRTLGPSPTLLISGLRHGSRDALRAAAQGATSRTVMRTGLGRRVWGTAVTLPGVPDRIRIKLARRVQGSMKRAGHPDSAARTAVAVGGRLRDQRMRAQLLGPVVDAELSAGRVPEQLDVLVGAELATADAHLRSRDMAKAGAVTGRVMDLLFHRVLHFDGLASPIAQDPAGFLDAYHGSAVGRRLAAPRGRQRPAAEPPPNRPLRLLFFTGINDNFLTPIRRRYENLSGVEVRCLDLSTGPVRALLGNGRAKLIAHGLAGTSQYGEQAERLLGPDLAWADIVFVDWCAASAGMLTMVDPGETRVIIRLHSFEAFTWWPHLVDFSRVDDVVFVSEHLRELTTAVVPRLAGSDAPRTHVIANAMELADYSIEKPDDARFTLGLVGISAVAKDPRWALRVLRLLRREDPRYRLLLIGAEIKPETGPAAARYHEAYAAELAELEPSGAVRRLGQLDDVPRALTDVGVILSTSVRESFHCALVEGAASGAVPVVRDWPFFAGRRHGARTLFPTDWVVETPEEAARRILAQTATDEIWRQSGAAAAAYARKTWDWGVTRGDFDRLLLGHDGPTEAADG